MLIVPLLVLLHLSHNHSITAFDISRCISAEYKSYGFRPTYSLNSASSNLQFLTRHPHGAISLAMAGRGETISTGLRRAEQWRNKGKALWNVERKIKSTPPIIHLSRFLFLFLIRLTAIAWLFHAAKKIIPGVIKFSESLPIIAKTIPTMPNLIYLKFLSLQGVHLRVRFLWRDFPEQIGSIQM
jgi:hypothetical protein